MYTIVELLEKRETFTILASFPGSPLALTKIKMEGESLGTRLLLYICTYVFILLCILIVMV